jgi:nitric oxide synthase oxygenase domain/subunit
VFAPADGEGTGPLIHNCRLIRYAGYKQSDVSVLGDPAEVALTARFVMEAEIAARSFGDTARHNALPVVADRMDLTMRSKDPFWRDHAASRQFMDRLAEEKSRGRIVPGD